MKSSEMVCGNLSEEQERTLLALLKLIIPPSEDGRMPGAADVGFFAYMNRENLYSWMKEGLLSINEESQSKYQQEFSVLGNGEQAQLIDTLRRKLFRFFSRLTTEVIKCYYLNDRVLEAIGLEARPPFPHGYLLDEGDLSLLVPVYERGKIYRD